VFNDAKPNMAGTANLMHLIAKRTLKREYKPLDIYNAMMRGPLAGPPIYPVGMGPPRPGIGPPPLPRPIITKKRVGGGRIRYRSDSETESDNSGWSSDSSVGQVRRHLRKFKTRKIRRERYAGDSSETEDSDASGKEEDVIFAKLPPLKRGEDVVELLLALWTAVGSDKGKGKGKEVAK